VASDGLASLPESNENTGRSGNEGDPTGCFCSYRSNGRQAVTRRNRAQDLPIHFSALIFGPSSSFDEEVFRPSGLTFIAPYRSFPPATPYRPSRRVCGTRLSQMGESETSASAWEIGPRLTASMIDKPVDFGSELVK
jgi:hypothetical protein